MAAEQFGTEHHEISLTPRDFWEFLPAYVWHMEEPVCEPPAVAGTARVVRAGYPDPTQFDPRDGHFDRDSLRDDPRWYAVDIKFESKFTRQVTLADLRGARALAHMELLRRGNRLSVQTVTAGEWKQIVKMGARA